MAHTARATPRKIEKSVMVDRQRDEMLTEHADETNQRCRDRCDSDEHQRAHGGWHLQDWTSVRTSSSIRVLNEPDQNGSHDEPEKGPSRVQRLRRKRGRTSETRDAQVSSHDSDCTDEPLSPQEPSWVTISDSPASTPPRGLPDCHGLSMPPAMAWSPDQESPGFPSPPTETWTPSSVCEMPRTPTVTPESSPSMLPTIWYEPGLEQEEVGNRNEVFHTRRRT